MPRSHVPKFPVQFELPSTTVDIENILRHKSVREDKTMATTEWQGLNVVSDPEKLEAILTLSQNKVGAICINMLSVLFLLHRLLLTPLKHDAIPTAKRRSRLPTGPKADAKLPKLFIRIALMLVVIMLVCEYQRHPIYLSLQRSYNEEGGGKGTNGELDRQDAYWLSLLLPIFSRLKWISFALTTLMMGRSYQSILLVSSPKSVWQLPNFLGTKDMIIPTVWYVCGILVILACANRNMIYFLGLAFELYRIGMFLTAGHCIWTMLPKGVRDAFDFSDKDDVEEHDGGDGEGEVEEEDQDYTEARKAEKAGAEQYKQRKKEN